MLTTECKKQFWSLKLISPFMTIIQVDFWYKQFRQWFNYIFKL